MKSERIRTRRTFVNSSIARNTSENPFNFPLEQLLTGHERFIEEHYLGGRAYYVQDGQVKMREIEEEEEGSNGEYGFGAPDLDAVDKNNKTVKQGDKERKRW